MPFHDGYFDGAYSTWAYFLPGVSKDAGLTEACRCIRSGGLLVVIDNAGEDEFTCYSRRPITTDWSWYEKRGFTSNLIEGCFRLG